MEKKPTKTISIMQDNIKEIGQKAASDLKQGRSWYEISSKYLRENKTRADVDYNNEIIDQINANLPEHWIKFQHYHCFIDLFY
jgi:hypothetical protein